MITEDIISDILAQTTSQMSGIDQSALRRILEGTLLNYSIVQKEGYGAASDVEEKIAKYLDCRKLDGISEQTILNYRYHLLRFSRYVQKRVSTITTQDIRSYLSDLVKTNNLKNSTLEGEKSILKSFFNWLETEEYIVKSPTKKIRPTKCPKKVRGSLTLEELEMMRDACKTPRQRCMLEIFFSTGVRLSELCQMNISDLDWQNNSMKVVGKGDKERIVYFSDKSRLHIKKYLAVRGSFESPALFITSKSPHERMGRKSVENEIKAIATAANLDKNVFPHLLRHTMATQGARSGMSVTSLHSILGHAKLDTTLVYIDSDQETSAYEHHRYLNQ